MDNLALLPIGAELSTNTQPIFKPKRKYTKRKALGIMPKETLKKRFSWKRHQTIKYCQFIKENRIVLQLCQKRHKQKIFNEMSSFVESRSKDQCKSHHQKMLERYKSISNILQNQFFITKETNIIHQDIDDRVQQLSTLMGTFCNLERQKPKERDIIGLEFFDIIENKNMVPENSFCQNVKLSEQEFSYDQEQYLNQFIAISSTLKLRI